ncbi:MAG: sigma-70 family RNA polymerase sigma factor [Candidatus Pseudobacter hemicellulosilyticus]|uniref:Sigma-70 family RNA polymerase sigma factor n=1 Tax=Candidatus Pseudobacter hemicellulosilyticus TaxID=3121375 RepID=A0AAJ5WXN9_9BACT|nr:MAG: sigma-70 family RNA polymerase sigma factor [Pseudobacter sp.]
MAAFHRGEQKALHAVYHRFLRPLCFFTEQLIGHTMAAEDIVADCFIQVFARKEDFPSLGQLQAFLYTAARNAALNHLKAQKRHEDIHQAMGKSTDPFTTDAEQAYIKAEALQAIFLEIEKLPPQCRQVVRLAIVEGKKAQEIADELGMAYQTVLNQKAKGLAQLRMALLKNELTALSTLAAILLL